MKYSASEVVEMAIQTERAGRRFYIDAAESSADRKLRELFTFLAAEEERHVRVFEAIARTVSATGEAQPYNWQEAALYLKAITDSRYFLGSDKALSLTREAATPTAVLDSALGFEKETLLFYFELVEMVGADARPAVAALIQQEKDHVRRLQGLRDSLAAPCQHEGGTCET